jgi:hypothetical protein
MYTLEISLKAKRNVKERKVLSSAAPWASHLNDARGKKIHYKNTRSMNK